MAIATYSDLQASVSDWLNRADLDSVIPDFITLAEAQINRQLRTSQMMKTTTYTVTSDSQAVPADWLETISLINLATKTTPMEYVDYESLNILKGKNLTGNSRYYTIIDDSFVIYPAGSASAPVSLELAYYGKIPALSVSNTTNWLLTKSPDLYLYATLVQAEPYLKNDERLNVWYTAMQTVMENIRLEADRAKRSSGGLRANRRSFG